MEDINLLIVFIEGILSIFSPCILPILPIYLSMLSNSSIDEIKNSKFKDSNVLLKNTIFFTLGISTTFFLLGSSINALTTFFNANKNMIMIIGGMIIIIMGLFYIGIIKSTILSREKRFSIERKSMSSITAFMLGFTFSFGWTPCIGPILTSVLIMSSSTDNIIKSNLLILTYTLGFILPFILSSMFYKRLFNKFDNIKRYMITIKNIGGIIIIIAGLAMTYNGFSNINKQLKNGNTENIVQETHEEGSKANNNDFSLYDQYGNVHTLSKYKDKTVFLNFWATWCPPCKGEMPYIEELYNEYNQNKDDVIILGVVSPNVGNEGSIKYIKEFLNNNGYTFTVVFDEYLSMMFEYHITAYPTTFIINGDGEIVKQIPGAMDKSTMKKIIEEERQK